MRAFTHDGAGTSAATWAAADWSRTPELDLDGVTRVVVVSAHPDDETLGAGGLVATAAIAGLDVHLVVCTAGEASHPHSITHAPEVLADLRRSELQAALGELAPRAGLTFVALPDGEVSTHEDQLVELLVRDLGDGRTTLVVAPWRQDGHPDHEAAGRAAALAAHRCGARLWEYPIWWWHWARPADAPWQSLRRLPLAPEAIAARGRALAHHRSQTEPLSDAPGDEALLQPGFLAHFSGPTERYVVQPTTDGALDRLHEEHEDPWQVDAHWYETRKRAVTLAALPRARFQRGLELGCSTGALAGDLAARCEQLVAVDSSEAAVGAARQRLQGSAHQITVERRSVPEEWPSGTFDLVVVSEVGYFLSPIALDQLVARVRESLTPDGVVVLCHWRHPIAGWPLDAAGVHATFEQAGVRPVQARHTEADFELLALAAPDAWTRADA